MILNEDSDGRLANFISVNLQTCESGDTGGIKQVATLRIIRVGDLEPL